MHTLSQLRAGQLAGARRLDLSEGLTEFPREIFDLADTLEVLNLSGNALTSLPDDLPRLHRLRVLFCSDNPFTELPAVLGRCARLEMVGFKANRIREVPGTALPPRLRWLILTDNRIARLPAEIGRCARLQKLMLAGNLLEDLPAELAACRQLELLRIAANRFQGMPAWLLSLPRLAWLACAGNPMERAVPAGVSSDIAWQQLQVEELLGEGASGLIYRAVWQPPASAQVTVAVRVPVPVAVKLFKGEVTSDGLPQSEMAASLAAGAHPHLIPVAGRLQGHPEGTPGLVMHFVPATFRTLAEPPSLASCTRDVYPATTVFTAAAVQRISHGAASALRHLHAQGLLHGDFYAHNLQCDAAGQALLGDMGAASVLPSDPVAARALQRLEVRAFGCLLEELLERMDENAGMSQREAWCRLRDDCLQEDTAARPLFADIAARLSD